MEKQSTYKIFDYCDLGLVNYNSTWHLQKELLELRLKGEKNDTLLLLEHPHTFTLGKTADVSNLLYSEGELKKKGINVFNIDRGGDITYHGPGQIVGYIIIDLNNWKKDTHLYLRAIEETIIRTCNDLGISTGRKKDYTGVWIGERKIAAIGVKVSRWITMHGFAFNINTDLDYYEGIIPCGIKDKEVTSLEVELNHRLNLNEVKYKIVNNFKDVFDYDDFEVRPRDVYITLVKN